MGGARHEAPPLAFVGPVMRKEFRQIRRDSRSLVFMIFLPAFLLVMFGFALNFDVKHIPIAVVDQDGSRASRELAEKFAATEYFDLKTRLARTGRRRRAHGPREDHAPPWSSRRRSPRTSWPGGAPRSSSSSTARTP